MQSLFFAAPAAVAGELPVIKEDVIVIPLALQLSFQ